MQSDPHAPIRHSAQFEFFGALNDFLQPKQRGRRFSYRFIGTPSVKDTIEAIGIPHTEVAAIRVDGRVVDFAALLQGGEVVRVSPQGSDVTATQAVLLRPQPPQPLRFVVDVNLGKLAAKLRLLGFDTCYRNNLEDPEIVACSVAEQRFILTRDIGVLKHSAAIWGYWVRAIQPEAQVLEVVRYLGLQGQFRPFRRCSACNGLLQAVDRAAVADRLPADTRRYYQTFFECADCHKLYWKGSHYRKITDWVETLVHG